MDILVLGGTQFVGRHLIDRLLAAGHHVSLFHRGKTNPGLFPEADHIIGDRQQSLDALSGRKWDVCFDCNAYRPSEVRSASAVLANHIGRYVFVSTISVYRDDAPAPVTEESPLADRIDSADAVDWQTYGGLKVGCEAAVTDAFGDRATIVRPGYIVGPYDPTYRFPYWVERIQAGGEVLVPAETDVPLQVVDGRDLAALMASLAEADTPGIFNAAGPEITFGAMLATLVAQGDAELAPVPMAWLTERNVGPAELPLYAGPVPSALMQTSGERAKANGLSYRPLAETARDTARWLAAERPALRGNPLLPDRAAELIQEWRGAA